MRRNTLMLRALGTLAVASLIVSGAARAQSAVDPRAAAALEAKATSQLDVSRDLGKAADLFVKASALRPATDPIGVGDLTAAASGYYLGGMLTRSRIVSVQAGERALAMGDVEEAAHAFLYAALVAHKQADDAGRDSLIARAHRLAASPLLSQAQQASILSRFSRPVRVAGQDR